MDDDEEELPGGITLVGLWNPEQFLLLILV